MKTLAIIIHNELKEKTQHNNIYKIADSFSQSTQLNIITINYKYIHDDNYIHTIRVGNESTEMYGLAINI